MEAKFSQIWSPILFMVVFILAGQLTPGSDLLVRLLLIVVFAGYYYYYYSAIQ